MGTTLAYKRPDGGDVSGYYAEPTTGDRAPGIVVIQEWWGVNEQIKGVANQLAESGYRALVPDLYRGKVTVDVAEAEHMMGTLDFADAARQDVCGAVQHLKANSSKVGVIGFCMGGALSLLAAVHVRQLDAVVSWYGVPPLDAADLRTITVPIQGHFAKDDAFFPPSQVEAAEAKFKEGKVAHELFWYEAKHAFGNETVANYDPNSKQLAWQRTLEFLEKQLMR